MSFISAKTDFGFKKNFGSPQSKEILISFLNAMLYDAQPTIEDLEIREIELVFVELPKFNKELEQLENLIQSWIYFIKNAPQFDEMPEKFASAPAIQTAFAIANRANLTLKELEELENREMFFEDQRGAIIKGFQEGRQEGLIQGQIGLILRQIARRTGEISLETQTRIQQLSPEQLDNLGEVLLDFTSQEDLIAWLESV
jgi:Domain of unknown function (DUF4351)/PD-(D/E)XK nuclease family transposase